MEKEEVITNFTDSESDDENNDAMKACCQETDLMIDSMKQEAESLKIVASCTKTAVRSDRFDLKVNPETRNILAKKLEDYLDDKIEIVENVQVDQKDILSCKKKFRLLSGSSIKFKNETYVDYCDFTVKRKSIPLHVAEPQKLSSAISPRFDITNILSELQPVECDIIL